jgi:hypothetical protein
MRGAIRTSRVLVAQFRSDVTGDTLNDRGRPILLKNSISLGRGIRLDRCAVDKFGSRATLRAS